jgi:hypothetical protein
MFYANLSEKSAKVLECYFTELLTKYERGESDELIVYLQLLEEEMSKRSMSL